MSLSSISLKRPVMAMVMSIVIVLFGVIGFDFLGVREYPSIDPPIITVRTNYTGAGADVVESQITEPLEKTINGIAGIRSISSSSNLGVSTITVEFDLDIDLEAAANDVRDKVSQAGRQLPQDIDAPPVVTKSDANSDAIISMTVQSDTRNALEITEYATNAILERLQTIPGVSTVQVWGERKFAMRLWMDPDRLAAHGLTPLDIEDALTRENVELPAGKISGAATELTVNAQAKLRTPEEFNDMIVASDGDKLVHFRDVGEARLGAENEENAMKQGGTPMIGLAVVPQPGANYIAIADEFYKRYEQLKKELPEDFRLNIALDNTRFVRRSISEVGETLAIAFLLVILIIYLFFRDWLIAIRPLIDIPVSLIGAFFIMYLAGFSINILTLLAIVLATGLVVDDGIVVTENIFKKLESGMKPMEAAEKGSNEIFFAVVSTSITLAIVFLPITFLKGFTGRLFREFGIVMAGAVLISAFVSLTLTPVLNVKLTRKDRKHSRFYEWSEPFFVNMTEGYRRSLGNFMKHRGWAFGILVLAAGLGIGLFMLLQSELAPFEDRSVLRVQVNAPEGTSYTAMEPYMDQLTRVVDDSVPEKRVCLTIVSPSFAGTGSVNTGLLRIGLVEPDERERSQTQIMTKLSKDLASFPQGRTIVLQEPTISIGVGSRTSQPVQFVLQNNSFEKLKEFVPKFLAEASKDPNLKDVDVNLKFSKPELNVTIDRERARALGVSVYDVARTLQLAYGGGRLSYFTRGGKQYQVIGQMDAGSRDEPLDLRALHVRSSNGTLIQLDDLLEVEEASKPPQLYHFNRYRSATVGSGLPPGKTMGDAIDALNGIADRVLDESFTTSLSGGARDFAESGSNTGFALVLALVLIYLVLAAQFESFRDPFIIMLTVPLAFTGAIMSLWIFNQTWNIFSQIGLIMLIGLVVKNGILIVEFANKQREAHGTSRTEAVIEAATQRLRPILMTNIATILGALPIAIGLGNGAQSRIPMGVVVVGGLLLSVLLTLYVIPAMYSFLASRERKLPDPS